MAQSGGGPNQDKPVSGAPAAAPTAPPAAPAQTVTQPTVSPPAPIVTPAAPNVSAASTQTVAPPAVPANPIPVVTPNAAPAQTAAGVSPPTPTVASPQTAAPPGGPAVSEPSPAVSNVAPAQTATQPSVSTPTSTAAPTPEVKAAEPKAPEPKREFDEEAFKAKEAEREAKLEAMYAERQANETIRYDQELRAALATNFGPNWQQTANESQVIQAIQQASIGPPPHQSEISHVMSGSRDVRVPAFKAAQEGILRELNAVQAQAKINLQATIPATEAPKIQDPPATPKAEAAKAEEAAATKKDEQAPVVSAAVSTAQNQNPQPETKPKPEEKVSPKAESGNSVSDTLNEINAKADRAINKMNEIVNKDFTGNKQAPEIDKIVSTFEHQETTMKKKAYAEWNGANLPSPERKLQFEKSNEYRQIEKAFETQASRVGEHARKMHSKLIDKDEVRSVNANAASKAQTPKVEAPKKEENQKPVTADDFYETLRTNQSPADIKTAFRKYSVANHPDKVVSKAATKAGITVQEYTDPNNPNYEKYKDEYSKLRGEAAEKFSRVKDTFEAWQTALRAGKPFTLPSQSGFQGQQPSGSAVPETRIPRAPANHEPSNAPPTRVGQRAMHQSTRQPPQGPEKLMFVYTAEDVAKMANAIQAATKDLQIPQQQQAQYTGYKVSKGFFEKLREGLLKLLMVMFGDGKEVEKANNDVAVKQVNLTIVVYGSPSSVNSMVNKVQSDIEAENRAGNIKSKYSTEEIQSAVIRNAVRSSTVSSRLMPAVEPAKRGGLIEAPIGVKLIEPSPSVKAIEAPKSGPKIESQPTAPKLKGR